MKLKRSNDRKVANSLTDTGNSRLKNTFGLPAGRDYSCPGATRICSKICYAGRLEKAYPAVMSNLLHNWELLREADHDTMEELLMEMIADFKKECDKWKAPKLFRIHWDGDFFSPEYAFAWKHVVLNNPDVKFWAYTRVEGAIRMLKDMDNLTIYYSGDLANLETAKQLASEGFKIAMLGETFDLAKASLGERAAICPEQRKQVALTGACVACKVCITGSVNVAFSITKK